MQSYRNPTGALLSILRTKTLSAKLSVSLAFQKSNRIPIVSTGKKSTPTLTGVFQIQSKLKSTRMRGTDYDIPDVPHTMYYSGGYAIHGAYWHRKFGTPISHGCVNLAPKQAKRLFNWASIGTPVVVQR